MIETRIVSEPLAAPAEESHGGDTGSAITFHGVVRDTEHGRPIVALEYEHYEGMAERELRSLAEETARRFGIQRLCCVHRVGRVPVGEASVRVEIRSRHRAEGIAALSWFIKELKRRVPIWKWALTAGGGRFPSRCEHEDESPDPPGDGTA